MIIGITGSLGTGKTTVAGMFAEKGAKVLDADRLSHMALKKGTKTYRQVVSRFGRSILSGDGRVNKGRLAEIAFSGEGELKALTDIVHPYVIGKIKEAITRARPDEMIVIDAPLLIEAGLKKTLDKLIVVKATRARQLFRCMKGKGLMRKEAIARIKNQMPLSKKARMADYVIDNNKTLNETKEQVNKIWRKIGWI